MTFPEPVRQQALDVLAALFLETIELSPNENSIPMTHTIIKPQHLERTAYVYLRQSSPGQVRRNREGRQRQQAMADRVAALGWVASKIVLLDGDSGQSGSSQQRPQTLPDVAGGDRDRQGGLDRRP